MLLSMKEWGPARETKRNETDLFPITSCQKYSSRFYFELISAKFGPEKEANN